MKAICTSACEVDGIGIVTQGEEIELHDGYANDPRINQHFVIDRSTIKDEKAKVPDFDAEKEACLDRFKKSLYNETDWWKAVNKLIDDGVTIPNEVLQRDDATLTNDERVERLAQIWTDSYGWAFPTDPKPKAKKQKGKEEQGSEGGQKDKDKKKPKPTKQEPEDLFGEGK